MVITLPATTSDIAETTVTAALQTEGSQSADFYEDIVKFKIFS